MTTRKLVAGSLIALAATIGLGASANATLIGPIMPYYGPSYSPFASQSFSYFYYDTFEEGSLTVPGVTASAGAVGTGSLYDSVEGPGPLGHSLFDGCGSCGITFTFSASVLGSLPTSAGIVWTDGDGPSRTFTAYDEHGVSLGSIVDSSQLFYSTGGDNNPSNYRFFGVTNAGGISSISISNSSGGIEVDDLQYGAATGGVPEPATWALMMVGVAGLGGMMRTRRRQVAATA